jgi:hypothetical protein
MSAMNIKTFLADSHGSCYASVARHPVLGKALAAAISEVDGRGARGRMVHAVGQYDMAALAAVVHDIEVNPSFAAAARSASDAQLARLKQAVGVAIKLVMAEEGWEPSLTADGRQDQGRFDCLRHRPRWFVTGRRYRPRHTGPA